MSGWSRACRNVFKAKWEVINSTIISKTLVDDNKYLLAHRFHCSNRLPTKNDFIQVGYFKGDDWDDFVMVDETNAWNWQTGSMMQWVDYSYDFIFNIFE